MTGNFQKVKDYFNLSKRVGGNLQKGYSASQIVSRLEDINTELDKYEARATRYGIVGQIANHFDLNYAALKGMNQHYENLLPQE